MARRSIAALAIVLIMTAALAPAVSALSWTGDPFVGKVGGFAGPPGAEVICRYDAAGRLSSVRVRPLTLNGAYKSLTYVGFQFQIREATAFRAGRKIYKSPIARQLASKSVATEFKSRLFRVKESLAGERGYYVRPVIYYFVPGSRKQVEGKAVLLYDSYLQKKRNQTFISNACTFDFGLMASGEWD
jgi:hypothetical protein